MRTVQIAFSAIFFLAGQANAMMCNCNRAYDPDLLRETRGDKPAWHPVFSRVREDLLFRKGDRIEIFAFGLQRPIGGTWALRRNHLEEPFLRDMPCELQPDHSLRMVVPEDTLTPGFYDLYFTVHVTADSHFTGRATFGYRVDDMPILDTAPADLDAFWQRAVASLDTVPPNVTRTFIRQMNGEEIDAYNINEASIPERFDPEGIEHDQVRVYKLSFDSLYDNAEGKRRYYAWLTLPAGDGPFPGLVVLPGFGNASLPIPAEQARHGYASLMLQIHGLDVDLPADAYKLPKEAGYGRRGSRGDGLTDDYYYYVYLACARAVRCLAGQPEVDADRLGVCGGSQGAHLSMATAALVPEIKAVANVLCYRAYWPYIRMAESLNKAGDPGPGPALPPFDRSDAVANHLSYYDAANFATLIEAPTLTGICLNDMPSPATTTYAVHRNLAAEEKQLLVSVGTNHDIMFAIETAAFRWMDRHLKSAAAPNR